MTITNSQLDAHLKTLKGQHNEWPGIPGPQCMVIFAHVNRLLAGPAYSAPGAKDLWNNPTLAGAYVQLAPTATPRFGDLAIHGPSWGGGWGHVSVVIEDLGPAAYNGFGQNPGPAMTTALGKLGLLGYLRPVNLVPDPAPVPPAPEPAQELVNRRVTQDVAWVRTAPASDAPLAPDYPQGVALGTNLAVRGFVTGQDPYGTGDNAWYLTRSGYFVWANAAENTLEGLPHL